MGAKAFDHIVRSVGPNIDRRLLARGLFGLAAGITATVGNHGAEAAKHKHKHKKKKRKKNKDKNTCNPDCTEKTCGPDGCGGGVFNEGVITVSGGSSIEDNTPDNCVDANGGTGCP